MPESTEVTLAEVPVAQIAPTPESKITFDVKASVAIDGTFDRWEAALKFASTDPTTGVLDIKVEEDSVNTGSGMKNTLRLTFLTRLGESSCDVWTLCRIADHSSIAISARYVHPSEDAVLRANS